MARLRYNILRSTLATDLLIGDTSIDFASALQEGGVNIPTITGGNIIALRVDSEVMHLTAYTAGATTGTVLRGQEDTAEDDHLTGANVGNVITKEDIAEPTPSTPIVTIRIAHSADSSAEAIAMADYVCDGTADDVQFQLAMADAMAVDAGQTAEIRISPGYYTFAAEVTVGTGLASGTRFVNIIGDDPLAWIEIERDFASGSLFDAVNDFIVVRFERVSLYDFVTTANSTALVDGNARLMHFKDCYIENDQGDALLQRYVFGDNAEFQGFAGGSGIAASGTAIQIELENCTFGSESGGFGIEALSVVSGNNYIVLDNCNFQGGVRLDGSTGTLPKLYINGGLTSSTLDHAFVHATDCEAVIIDGLRVATGTGASVENIIHLDNVDFGLISDLILDQGRRHGIYLNNCDKIEIHGCQIFDIGQQTDNTYAGIFLDSDTNDCFIHDNLIRSTSANKALYGIRVDDSTCDNNTIINNDLRSSSKTAGNEFSDAGTGTVAGLEGSVIDGFWQDNVAASQTAVVLAYGAVAARTEVPMPASGAVIGIVVFSNAARTNGTLTVDATINGTVTGCTAVLDGTNTTTKATRQGNSADKFTAGQRIGVKITTDGTWAPTTADIDVAVLVSLDVANRI